MPRAKTSGPLMPIASLKEMLTLTEKGISTSRPGPGRVNIMISLSPSTLQILDTMAEKSGMRRARVIEQLILDQQSRKGAV